METIRSQEFHLNWGGFLEDIKTKDKFAIFYNTVFMSRRLIYCAICFFKNDKPGM